MVGLDKSFVVPLSVMSIVPLCLIGIMPMLYLTGTAVNVQSLLGFIFIVGIKVANTVLMTDYAQELRRHEGLSPIEAIRKAAGVRVRPITMTALAAFFAMVPGALALERGSEANAPLARAILGGLLAGEPATLFVLPVIYSLLVRDSPKDVAERGGPTQFGPSAQFRSRSGRRLESRRRKRTRRNGFRKLVENPMRIVDAIRVVVSGAWAMRACPDDDHPWERRQQWSTSWSGYS